MTVFRESEQVENIIKSAALRADLELSETRSLLRTLFGDSETEHKERAKAWIAMADAKAREPPPAPEVRKKLKKWWGWSKR